MTLNPSTMISVACLALLVLLSPGSATPYKVCRWCFRNRYRSKLDLFRSYTTSPSGGPAYFDNSAQVRTETKTNSPEKHPYARHVNYDFTHRVLNKPVDFGPAFYLLEETYFWRNRNGSVDLRPLFILFDLDDKGDIRLTSLDLPSEISDVSVLASSPYLHFNYTDLTVSKMFPIIPSYSFDKGNLDFNINVSTKVPGGLNFALIEKFETNRLLVLEKLSAVPGGPNIFGYETPIVYNRLSSYDSFFHDDLSVITSIKETPFGDGISS